MTEMYVSAIALGVIAVCNVMELALRIRKETRGKCTKRKSGKKTAVTFEDDRATEISEKGWENFLSYDGDRQANIMDSIGKKSRSE